MESNSRFIIETAVLLNHMAYGAATAMRKTIGLK